MDIVLASKSPRRRDILTELGVKFTVDTANTEEKSLKTDPCEFAKEISYQKGAAVAEKYGEDTLVISCDTVVFADGRILGKPKNVSDAEDMLRLLSGKTHKVISGLTLFWQGKVFSDAETTYVTFAELPEKMIKKYAKSGDPLDKAGGYAVQGKTALFVEKIDGCYFNVVGFPVRLFEKLSKSAGIDLCDLIF